MRAILSVRNSIREQMGRSAFDVVEQCPMRGRRGPDMATNQYRRVFTEHSQEHEDILFMVHLAGLSQEDQRDLMLDFAAGRARLSAELDIRLSVWNTLPLKLFGLAYHDTSVAREAVLNCLLQYEQLTEEEQRSSAHALTRFLLSKDGPHRADVMRWVQGQDMSETLRAVASQMLLSPTLEVSVERLHAFLSNEL